MKKISFILASALALLSFTSCEDEKKPVFEQASSDSFEVYQPALQNQYYELTATGTFDIDCKSAPNYGAPIGPTIYGAQVSLSQDFSTVEEITAETNASRMIFKDEDLAVAICKLSGLTKNDVGYVFESPVTVYFKATCSVDGIENSKVVSKNYVQLNKVMPYFAIPTPGFIYLVGEPEGWAGPAAGNAEHYADWRLFEAEDAIGSHIYYGTFDIPADKTTFRFYTLLTGWDNDSYGSQVDDNPKDYTCAEGAEGINIVKGKGSFKIIDWPGGKMSIKVDMSDVNNMKLTVTPAN